MSNPSPTAQTSSSSPGERVVARDPFPEWMTHFHAVRNFVTGLPWNSVRQHADPEHQPNRRRTTGGFRYAR